jgi:hypothetical protein
MQVRKGELSADVYRRYVHQAIAHGLGEWSVYENGSPVSGKNIALMLGISYENYKSYRKRAFEPQRFPSSDLLEKVAREEAEKFTDFTPAMYDVLVMR